MDEITTRYEAGKGYLRTKAFAEAAAAFQSLVEDDPSDAEAWQFLGAARSQEKNWAAAISAFRKAEALDPSARNQYNLAVALSEGLSRYDEARLYLERALEKDPNHAPSKEHLRLLIEQTAAPAYDARQAQVQIQQLERQRGPVPVKRKIGGIVVASVVSVVACGVWWIFPFRVLVAFGAGWLVGLLTAKACGRGGQTAARIAGWTSALFFIPLCGWFLYADAMRGNTWNILLDLLAMYLSVSQSYKIALNTE